MNSMTITQKILAAHCGKASVEEGEFVLVEVDLALGNDITAPLAIEEIEKLGLNSLPYPDKIVLVPDHFTPNKDIRSAQQCKMLRDFAKKYQIKNYFEVGKVGIEHALLPEQGMIYPGQLVIGADSHTCTYGALGAFSTGVGSTDLAFSWLTGKVWLRVPESMKFIYYGTLNPWVSGKDLILHTIGDIGVDGATYKSMEFTGETIGKLSIASRLTICNMAVEAGAKNGIIEPDNITQEYLKSKIKNQKSKIYRSNEGAKYAEMREYDVSKIEPQVAFPHLPSNSKPVREAGNIAIDQVVIGSCTNGRLEDLQVAARILKGEKVHSQTRLIVIPATQKIYLQALKEGLIEIFITSGGLVSPPTCGPCLGGHMGILAQGERCVATTNRNFVGRMGHTESEVYLASPAVAAASAIKGRIAHPEEVIR